MCFCAGRHSIAFCFSGNASVMSSSTLGLKSDCSGWCGSKKNTGGAPMISSVVG